MYGKIKNEPNHQIIEEPERTNHSSKGTIPLLAKLTTCGVLSNDAETTLKTQAYR